MFDVKDTDFFDLEDESFDLVTAFETVYFWPDPDFPMKPAGVEDPE